MPAPTSVLSFGDIGYRIKADQPRLRANAPHELEQTWCAAALTDFTLGTAPPDYAGMRLVEITPQDAYEGGGSVALSLSSRGILDGSRYLRLGTPRNASAEEGWDTRQAAIYTAYPADPQWAKGQRPQGMPITGITATAADDKLTKAGAFSGLTTGQAAYFDFGSGFTGLTSGSLYYVILVDGSNIKLAASNANALAGTAINITLDGVNGTLRPVIIGHELMFMTDREDEEDDAPDYWSVNMGFKGLLATSGMFKGVKRRINTTAQTLANDEFSGIIIAPVYSGYPPTAVSSVTFGPPTIPGAIPAEFDLPQISVTDTFISTSAPPTNYLPGYWIPADAPSVSIISTGGDNFTYHWPSGWKILNIQSEQLAGLAIWLISLTWGYQLALTPRSAPAA